MKIIAFLLLTCLALTGVSAQDKPVKPDTVLTLNMNKLQERFQQLVKERERQVKARDDAENAIKAIDGALQAFQIVATDSTLQVTKPKK